MVPKFLFNTVLTVINFHIDPSGHSRLVFVLGTHGTAAAAKSYTISSLQELNFTRDEFEEYDVRAIGSSSAKDWAHGEGIVVFARAPTGQVFLVGIDTTPNNESLPVTHKGEMILPGGARFLHYVVQSIFEDNANHTSLVQTSEIEGVYVHRADAWMAAHRAIDATQFAKYGIAAMSSFPSSGRLKIISSSMALPKRRRTTWWW